MMEVHRESGGFTPPVEDAAERCPACLRAPREIHISDSAAYFTGVAKNDRIGRARLDLLHRSYAIPLGFTLWNACEG
jgi:hypothetical protein